MRRLAIGKQFRQRPVVVELNIVLGIDQKNRFSDGVEGRFPALPSTGNLFVELSVLNADGQLFGQMLNEAELFLGIGRLLRTADQQKAASGRLIMQGGNHQRMQSFGQMRITGKKRVVLRQFTKNQGFVKVQGLPENRTARHWLRLSKVKGGQRLDHQFIVLQHGQAEQLAGQRFGQQLLGFVEHVLDGHFKMQGPGQAMENFQADILPANLFLALLQLGVIAQFGRINTGQVGN